MIGINGFIRLYNCVRNRARAISFRLLLQHNGSPENGSKKETMITSSSTDLQYLASLRPNFIATRLAIA